MFRGDLFGSSGILKGKKIGRLPIPEMRDDTDSSSLSCVPTSRMRNGIRRSVESARFSAVRRTHAVELEAG
jgi:hypothetical protein